MQESPISPRLSGELNKPAVSADNNFAECDARSVATARADGDVNRTDRGSKVFANNKSVIRTCPKLGIHVFDDTHQFRHATLTSHPPPLAQTDA